ncbi:MAG: hypothetical protein L3J52_06825 [Proteobacteria bacterium]|nr:hypothetical protein [Pseudomonadota bacterium]
MKKKLMTTAILFYLFNPIQLTAAEWSEPVRLTEVGLDKNRTFDASEPAVAINSTTGSYIVVWEGNDDRPDMASAEVEIFANLFSPAGTLVNPDPIRVSFMGQANSLGYDGRKPEIVYNPNMNE